MGAVDILGRIFAKGLLNYSCSWSCGLERLNHIKQRSYCGKEISLWVFRGYAKSVTSLKTLIYTYQNTGFIGINDEGNYERILPVIGLGTDYLQIKDIRIRVRIRVIENVDMKNNRFSI